MNSKLIAATLSLMLMFCCGLIVFADTSSAKVTDLTVNETGVCAYGVVKENYREYYSNGTDTLASNYQKDKTIYAYIPGSEEESKFLKYIETKGAEGDILLSNYSDIHNASIYRFTNSDETYVYYSVGLDSYKNVEVIAYGYFAAYKIVADSTVSVESSGASLQLRFHDSDYDVSAGGSSDIHLNSDEKYLVLVISPDFISSVSGPADIKSNYLCNVSYSVGNVDLADGAGETGALYLAYGLIGICLLFFLVKIIWKKQPRWSAKPPKWSKH